MRENNFSIPNANKASVGITPALYDRRALDCTSTLPLINSLNNLAYLTTSSARIRDILTVDGGVERLVCILKEGRSKEAMDMWKWNLAFQCVVNIGVRGSEAVRTRVVEADMVPVVATILDNYIQAIEKCREREMNRNPLHIPPFNAHSSTRTSSRSSRLEARSSHRSDRSRRHAPPPIEIPQTATTPVEQVTPTGANDANTAAPPAVANPFSSPPDRAAFLRQRGVSPLGGQDNRPQFSSPIVGTQTPAAQQVFNSSPFGDNVSGFGIRPVRDIDRLPSMVPTLNAEMSSQPVSPSTPSAPVSSLARSQVINDRPLRRPSIRHQLSISGTNWEDDEQTEDSVPDISDNAETSPEPMAGLNDVVMQDIVDDDRMLQSRTSVVLDVPTVNVADTDALLPAHRSERDGSINNPERTPPQTQPGFNPVQPLPPVNLVNATPPNVRQTLDSYYGRLPALPNLLAALPRDEDVIMALQLLAYVSKYCNLRSYFQATHLVPRLKVGAELKVLETDGDASTVAGRNQEELDEDWDNEFVPKAGEQPYNIFPLIEKFTVRTSSSRHALHPTSPQQSETMQYWAGVVMRNLCRKDESRGGIRQCAYWKCGKWEEFTRQFAKCRRCRRTKYCSKECQKGAWGTHRFWCVAAEEGRDGEGSRHHGHHHHHSHRSREAASTTSTARPNASS